jgi:hypothetical protein
MDVKLAVTVLAHRAPRQLARLLSAMRDPRVTFYVHIDRRADLAAFTRQRAAFDGVEVVLLPRRRTRWGGVELVDATLDGLARAVADGCTYFVLISGQDFPLRPVAELLEFVEAAGDRSYVEHWPLPDPRWRLGGRDRTDFYTYDLLGRRETCIPRGEDVSYLSLRGQVLNETLRLRTVLKPARRMPPYVRPFGGMQWLNLSRAAVEHILRFVGEHPDYRRYHQHTLAPDEIFFQSILAGSDFTRQYELVSDSLRFMVWPAGSAHPGTLTAGDLPSALRSSALFARKFDAAVDEDALMRLAELVSL